MDASICRCSGTAASRRELDQQVLAGSGLVLSRARIGSYREDQSLAGSPMRKIINSTYITLDGVIQDPQQWPSLGRPSDERGGQIQTDLLCPATRC